MPHNHKPLKLGNTAGSAHAGLLGAYEQSHDSPVSPIATGKAPRPGPVPPHVPFPGPRRRLALASVATAVPRLPRFDIRPWLPLRLALTSHPGFVSYSNYPVVGKHWYIAGRGEVMFYFPIR